MKAHEVMEVLGVSKMTLHNYVKAGKIGVDKAVNARVIEYNAESVRRLAESAGINASMSRIVIYRNGTKMEIKLDDCQLSEVIDIIKTKFLETI